MVRERFDAAPSRPSRLSVRARESSRSEEVAESEMEFPAIVVEPERVDAIETVGVVQAQESEHGNFDTNPDAGSSTGSPS